MKRYLGVLVLLAAAVGVRGQSPSADWKTISTAHFRVHYPEEYAEWSRRATSRLESIREAVVREVGYDPPQSIEVVVMNPLALANGAAWPLLDAPRVILFTEPPGPDEAIGSYADWIDLLSVHEITHIVHMLRPSRNPIRRAMERFVFPFNPVTLSSPRWVLEGYATVIEGRLTGAGRPNSTIRALILRKWAASGRLPGYSQLNSDSRFMGMSMAYLAGSAFLEWLEDRAGPESLRHLWARMTARQTRSFDAAFIGVFGEPPARLYDRFSAELTASAVALDRSTPLRDGELFEETTRASGDPAVSPDGSKIAVVLRPRNEPAKLVIWPAGPNEEEERKYKKRLTRILELDPSDIPPVRPRPLPRKPLHSFTAPDGGAIETPRWTHDGQTIIYSHRQPDLQGFLHHDLFAWTPSAAENVRITRLADVKDADPYPDRDRAIAVRTRNGYSQLVDVDLGNGSVTPLTEPSIGRAYSHPRVSADGKRAVFVVNDAGGWRLMIRNLTSGVESRVPLLEGSTPSWPEWNPVAPNDDLLVTLSSSGYAEIHRVSTLGGISAPITRSSGGAFQPAPSTDRRLYFMGLEPDGFVVRTIDPATTAAPPPAYNRALVPAIPPTPPHPVGFETETLSGPGRYGIGKQELSLLFAQNLATSNTGTEAGLRLGDIVGRLDTLMIGSFGRKDAQRGFAIASAWRRWPVEVSAHAFTARDRRAERRGLELRGSWSATMPGGVLSLEAGLLKARPFDLAFAQASLRMKQMIASWHVDETLLAAAEGGSGSHYRGIVGANVRRKGSRFGVEYQRDSVADPGSAARLIEVGGLPSSIIPGSAFASRVFDPALPPGILTGRRYERRRAEVVLPILPVTFLYQQHRLPEERMSLAGAEIAIHSPVMPILRLPALDMTAGAARILSGPLKSRTRAWFGLRWRP